MDQEQSLKGLNSFIYGYKVKIIRETDKKSVLMKFCQSNYSFVEFIRKDYRIEKILNLYNVIDLVDEGINLEFQFKNHSLDFQIET